VGGVFLASGCAALVGGLLDMFAPSLTIRWQVRSTATHGGTRRAVGLGFQGALGIDPTLTLERCGRQAQGPLDRIWPIALRSYGRDSRHLDAGSYLTLGRHSREPSRNHGI
jgi:hypothetical protein